MDGRTLEKRYDQVLQEVQYLRDHCRHLEQELRVCRPALYRADQRIDRLQQSHHKYRDEHKRPKQKLADDGQAATETQAHTCVREGQSRTESPKPGRRKCRPARCIPGWRRSMCNNR
jgi:septal ring factor EnvC (AmiA/AmiB activator)